MTKKVLVIFGTRPEAIKMAPVLQKLGEEPDIQVKLCITAQHRSMLDQVLKIFDLKADYDLDLMQKNQSLSSLTSSILTDVETVIKSFIPDLILVHGDTTTTSAASLSAFLNRIPIGHIEAGLRTGNINSPWPEEANRKLTACLASIHFAPTKKAMTNLLNENINLDNIFVTGNTVIDALLQTKKIIDESIQLKNKLQEDFNFLNTNKKIILVTGHRRESFGIGFEHICTGIKKVAENNSDIHIVYPAHLNPNVVGPVNKILKGIKNISIIEPLDYLPFVYLMTRSYLILTDSGGIQEEAPSLGKPVLLMRDTTERPEAVSAGTVKLVGTDPNLIYKEIQLLLDDKNEYDKMSFAHNPYGDGNASSRVVDVVKKFLLGA